MSKYTIKQKVIQTWQEHIEKLEIGTEDKEKDILRVKSINDSGPNTDKTITLIN